MTAPLVRLGHGDFIRDIHPHDFRPLSRSTMPATAPRIKQIVRGRVPAPRRTLVYGTPGIGKSTFASMADRPVFVSTEDGLSNIDCERFPLCTRYRDVLEQLESLHGDEHGYRTIAIDSLDWLERLIWAEVCSEHGVKNIEEIGYAKGYAFALTYWREVLAGLDALRHDRGMDVILVAHARIERFENPETDPYDRYVPRLHKLASALVQEWCDEVLFASYRVLTRKVDEAFGQQKHRGLGTGERVIRTTERPSHIAKNRLDLPDEIPLDYRVYASFVRGEPAAIGMHTDHE
jgi:hypothetical protein